MNTPPKTIGILGSGVLGRAIATKAVAGYDVAMANSKGPKSLEGVVRELGPRARAATVQEAAAADVVVLAVPFFSVPELQDLVDWSGKIVVDATNQFAAANPWRGRYDVGDLTGSEWVARQLPGARIVKAFNTVFASFIAAAPRSDGSAVLFYAGDDADAKAIVGGLLTEFGFAPIDLGGLREGGALMQLDGPLNGRHFLLIDPADAPVH